MPNLKVVSIVGARPQFIKASVVSRALRSVQGIKEIIVHTGQHYDIDLSDVFFEELGLPEVDFNLGIGSGSHGYQTGKMLEKIEELLIDAKPDLVLVYGDTNSTLAGALASAKLHIPTAHIEAGLRSFNRKMPEEINRVLTDHSSDILFAPTKTAVNNLLKEGIIRKKIKLVGDVMYDVALHYSKKAEQQSNILEKHGLNKGEYILATVHRAENTDSRSKLLAIMKGLTQVSKVMPVILPLHPRTRNALKKEGININLGNLLLTGPLGYLDMITLEKNAALVATDSGGVQKEAYFFRVPCLTLRYETEWVELVETGWNHLCPPSSDFIIHETIIKHIGTKGDDINLFGKGTAAKQIVNRLQETYLI